MRVAFPRDRRFLIAAALGFSVLVWVWRRPGQLTHPYIWGEESFILDNYVKHGWSAAVRPLEGYIELPATFLTTLGAQFAMVHLPVFEYVCALLVYVGTMLLLLLPDSRWGDLRMRAAMVVAAVLVPVNPETFGVLLYSFWWSTLWPLIALGWKRTMWPLRAPVLAIAALSSPASGALFVLYAFEYVRKRQLRDAIGAGILL